VAAETTAGCRRAGGRLEQSRSPLVTAERHVGFRGDRAAGLRDELVSVDLDLE
jgi:hypothetical protein